MDNFWMYSTLMRWCGMKESLEGVLFQTGGAGRPAGAGDDEGKPGGA